MTVDGLTGYRHDTGTRTAMVSKAPAAVVIEDGVYVPMD